jgi:hypothetical protein
LWITSDEFLPDCGKLVDVERQIVFVPLSAAQKEEVVSNGLLKASLLAFSANGALAETFDLAPNSEEVEYAALQVASVAALSAFGARLVVAAELPSSEIIAVDEAEEANGGVTIAKLELAAVTAFFTDSAAPELIEASAAAAKDLSVDEAWEAEPVQRLLSEADLLWHDVSELG